LDIKGGCRPFIAVLRGNSPRWRKAGFVDGRKTWESGRGWGDGIGWKSARRKNSRTGPPVRIEWGACVPLPLGKIAVSKKRGIPSLSGCLQKRGGEIEGQNIKKNWKRGGKNSSARPGVLEEKKDREHLLKQKTKTRAGRKGLGNRG